jgi:catechol 2,3-dioxygenase-like lactoylglutathione lyase family enzyme
MIEIDGIDHIVLTVRHVERTCDFYSSVLGMEVVAFRGDRKALRFGTQKINLHEAGRGFEPKAEKPTPGSADICFITTTSLDAVVETLQRAAVAIEEGPVERTGATGSIKSVYVRDPDRNLIEISTYTGS